MKAILKNSINKGALHILSSNILNRAVFFLSSILIIRILSKSDFGIWAYSMNIINMFLLLNGLGSYIGALQYCTTEKTYKGKISYFKYAISLGYRFNIILSLAIIISTYIIKFPILHSNIVIRQLALIPLVIFSFEILKAFMRSNLKNTQFSILNFSNAFLLSIGTISGAYLFKLNGVIYFRYLAIIISCLMGFKLLKLPLSRIISSPMPSLKMKEEFRRYSITALFANSSAQILYVIDTFLVGAIIQSQSVIASYKTATLIPFALNFIPISISMFVYPYFAKNLNDKTKIGNYYLSLLKLLIPLNFLISTVLYIFAPFIIRILFSADYLDSVHPFRILIIGYFFAGSFRIPAGNILASIKKVNVNLYNSVICGAFNIVLDIFLIKKWGANGAAIATVSIFIFSSIISNIYIFNYIKKK